ncbi:23S rRNA pseudouridine2605 synthase [Actinoalloteichus hoggarensis]|uniref:Pseudouridine synthase n=1 Tax=Actinoalloteichus hoggarensis TaxID=1470176 RepID=A0A221W7P7_9PSEU|nr:Ribosomal large subunit pseudouridine synthase B [Actinoalloteichus hoggarensis]MBB5921340.1 23S rRNA pseudouridine2605 synthase [Actinoalloteichus hoggarensis]
MSKSEHSSRPPRRERTAAPGDDHPEGIRLQKVLSRAGIASRRAAEELIAEGRVSIDGKVVTEMGRRVDPATVTIHVDGTRVVVRDDLEYLALNKPVGMHSTMSDDMGRPCIGDLITSRSERLFHVGRLDAETEGLLLLTNDGDLAHRLMHPSYEVSKTYLAEVPAPIAKDVSKTLKAGVELEDGPASVDSFRVLESYGSKAMVEVVLHEGRKHIVRRLLDHIGHPVERLVRTSIGEVKLGDQRPGSMRRLNHPEIGSLYRAVGL